MHKLLSSIFVTTLATSAFAGDCELSIDRKPCPGKEAAAFKPYDGKNPTIEKKAKAVTLEACTKEGEAASKIVRKGTLAEKTVTIKFDGKDISKKSDKSECK